MKTKIDTEALTVAAKKLRKLRLEDVGGYKERPAETVASVFERGWRDAGSQEAIEYILKHGVRYYLDAASNKSE